MLINFYNYKYEIKSDLHLGTKKMQNFTEQ